MNFIYRGINTKPMRACQIVPIKLAAIFLFSEIWTGGADGVSASIISDI
jgi:hypothetical protein